MDVIKFLKENSKEVVIGAFAGILVGFGGGYYHATQQSSLKVETSEARVKLAQDEQLRAERGAREAKESLAQREALFTSVTAEMAALRSQNAELAKQVETSTRDLEAANRDVQALTAANAASKALAEKQRAENAKLAQRVAPKAPEAPKPIALSGNELAVFRALHKRGASAIGTLISELGLSDGTIRFALNNLYRQRLGRVVS